MLRRNALALLAALALAGCNFMLRDTDIPGVYTAARGVSSETLRLNADGTYVHEWVANGEEGRATGGWRIHMLGYGFAQIILNNYQDKLDPAADPEPIDWNTDVKRSAPWDRQTIPINMSLDLAYEKENGAL